MLNEFNSNAISFGVAIWNGKDWEEALKDSVYSGLKVGGVAWAGSIVAAQLGRTGMEQTLRGATDYLVKNIKYVHQLQNLFFALTGTELQFAEE